MHENVSIMNNLTFASIHSERQQSLYFIILFLAPHELDHPLFSPPPPHELKPNSAHGCTNKCNYGRQYVKHSAMGMHGPHVSDVTGQLCSLCSRSRNQILLMPGLLIAIEWVCVYAGELSILHSSDFADEIKKWNFLVYLLSHSFLKPFSYWQAY